MFVVTQRHLHKAAINYPDAANEITAWYATVKQAQWHNLFELRQVFADADEVDGCVIFNIRHNRYRLVTVVHYARERNNRSTRGHVYIRSFLTHAQCNLRSNWDKEYGQ